MCIIASILHSSLPPSLPPSLSLSQGIRIFLSSLETHANRYKRYIVPLLSSCIDFYIRVFVQVFTSPSQVKRSLRSAVNYTTEVSI